MTQQNTKPFIDKYIELVPLEENILALRYGNFIIAEVDLNDSLFPEKSSADNGMQCVYHVSEHFVYPLCLTVVTWPYALSS